MRVLFVVAALSLAAGGATAETALSQMEGAWAGSGWAKRTPNHPQEKIRCRMTNTYDQAREAISVDGLCAVSGRQITMAGALQQVADDGRLEGQWDNSIGGGQSSVEGQIADGMVYVEVEAAAIGSGDDVSQTLRWSFANDGGLLLQSTLLEDPSIVMSEITFK